MNDEQLHRTTLLLVELLGTNQFVLETTDDTVSVEVHERSLFEQVQDVFVRSAAKLAGCSVLIYEPDVEDGIGWTVTLTVGR